MLHPPAPKAGNDPALSFKKRLGVMMFLAYLVIYAGFVAINLLKPAMMARTVLLGLNLAIVYGFALIIAALALALVYNHMCTTREKKLGLGADEKESH